MQRRPRFYRGGTPMRDLDYTEEGHRLYRGGTSIIQRGNSGLFLIIYFLSLSLLPIQFPPLANNPV